MNREEMLATSVDPDKLSARLDELEAITYKSYEYGWDHFRRWCDAHNLAVPATARTANLYLVAHKSDAHTTLRARVRAIRRGHQQLDAADPTTDPDVIHTIRWHALTYGTAAAPVSAATRQVLVRLVCASRQEDAAGPFVRARTRSLMTISYGAALRGCEAVALRADNIALQSSENLEGLVLQHTKSSDKPASVFVESPPEADLDPSAALREYLQAGRELGVDLRQGHLYRPLVYRDHRLCPAQDKPLDTLTYWRNIKRLAIVAGLDEEGLRLAMHSFRRGWATDAANDGRSVETIKKHGLWERLANAQRYIDRAGLYRPELQLDY